MNIKPHTLCFQLHRRAIAASRGAGLLSAALCSAASLAASPVDATEDATPAGSPDPAASALAAPLPDKPAPAKADPVRVVWSQFADMPVSGDAKQTVRYGGKIDAYIDVTGDRFGIDPSFTLHIRPEFKYGKSANGTIGLIPSNTQLFYPGDGDVFDLSVNVTKKWNDGSTLTVGKVNVLDLAAQLPVVGGGGHEGFQNLSMALPPSAIVPNSITGALFQKPTKGALYRLWVFDARSQSRRSGLDNFLSEGVGFLASITVPAKVAGKRGYYAVKLAGSSRRTIAAESLPPVLVPARGAGFSERRGELSVVLAGYQNLVEYAEHPGKGWGVFGQVYLSRGDPTFLDRSAFLGVSGNPRFRPDDRFGVSWFRYSLTNKLVRVLDHRLALEDEEGVEAFYTVQLARPARLTASVQVIDSAIAARRTGGIAGLRLTTQF